jgi:hypothetical protein
MRTLIINQDLTLLSQFPSIADIMADTDVVAAANAAWAQTLAATSDNSRREQGYWITLDSNQGKYLSAASCVGTPVVDTAGAALDTWQPMPADSPANPTPLDRPTYTVGWFHTHTPTTFRDPAEMGAGGRANGPSANDLSISSNNHVPGIAYDYSANPVPPNHPLNSAAQMFTITPPDRRPTP